MRSKCLALMLADLGVTKTHSPPHVSDDNPYSESHFKTLKYRPDFPARFGSLEDARAFCKDFFDWYNLEHHHAALPSSRSRLRSIRSASCAELRTLEFCRRPRGSINRAKRRRQLSRLSKFMNTWSQNRCQASGCRG